MENRILLKKLDRIALIVTAVVLAVVVALRYLPPLSEDVFPFDIHILPALHAVFNSLTAISLILAIYFIKQKNVKLHQRMIYTAMGLSGLFLISYITYHFATDPTHFGDINGDGLVDAAEKTAAGGLRTFYLILLASHIILAAAILPFILYTFNRGFTKHVEKHRKIARWTFPLWLYVAITGVVCYLMLQPYYH